jgi:hypothetical protein
MAGSGGTLLDTLGASQEVRLAGQAK